MKTDTWCVHVRYNRTDRAHDAIGLLMGERKEMHARFGLNSTREVYCVDRGLLTDPI